MWIEPYKNKYRAVERYTDPLTGKTKRVSTIINKDTKASRKAAESVLRTKIDKEQAVASSGSTAEITLKNLADKYLEHQRQNIKPSSFSSTEFHINHILDIIGKDTIVSRLTAGYVSDLLAKKSKTPYMTNRNIIYFKALIRWAYDHDYIMEKSWIDKIKYVKAPKPSSSVEDHYLEAKELRTLIDSISSVCWKLMTEFLALSGLRIGEAMALLVSDVDDYIHVTKTYHTASMELSDTPKTDSSNRDVFIQPELAGVIRKIRKYRNEVMMRTGSRADIFFPEPDGYVFSYDYYRQGLKKHALQSINRSVSPHMLRHTHVSLLAEQGIPLDAISRRLGHHNCRITKEVYLHVTQKQKQKEEKMISNVKIL